MSHKIKLDPGNAGFNEMPGTFAVEFARRELPGYGNTPQYAYESLALSPSTFIGAGVRAGSFSRAFQPPQIVQQQTYHINGIPLTAGQIVGQPLYDPSAGGFTDAGV